VLGVGLRTGSPEVAPGCDMAHMGQSRTDSGLAFEAKEENKMYQVYKCVPEL